ncbi:MAG: hypothetical protein PWP49_1628 [Thermococcaceae archaeon]|nr:hypothetical protein [Thermococcaceae archaeon]MDN5321208.1 hypothetical protein [Thermococcaceae archaeon]
MSQVVEFLKMVIGYCVAHSDLLPAVNGEGPF